MSGDCNNVHSSPSIVFGETESPLLDMTIGHLVKLQAGLRPNKEAWIFSAQGVRTTFRKVELRTRILAKALLDVGLRKGDHIGIMAGNCWEFVEIFLAACRLGCPCVTLNSTYTTQELVNAVQKCSCRFLFIANTIGPRCLAQHIDKLVGLAGNSSLPDLQHLIRLQDITPSSATSTPQIQGFSTLLKMGRKSKTSDMSLRKVEQLVSSSDVATLQFTSGTTGNPKLAMLTHSNLINNARFLGDRMHLLHEDIGCCLCPLFHIAGLSAAFIASFFRGSCALFPSEIFNPNLALDAITIEKATAIYGVPTMFAAILEVKSTTQYHFQHAKKGFIAGAVVPIQLYNQIRASGVSDLMIPYGMTETSPCTFSTSYDDSLERRAATVGRVMPHTGAKIVNRDGNIVERNTRGELCTSGHSLQQGYYKDPTKTAEVMKVDENGVLWMHTGDECTIDDDGYCTVTGRIKDIIIRGAENIYPGEIEVRLLDHPAVSEAVVVGIPDDRYGEVVGSFLKHKSDTSRPSPIEIADWVRQVLGRHKAPKHIFWLGDPGVGDDYPITGSGKLQKHVLRDLALKLLAMATSPSSAKL